MRPPTQHQTLRVPGPVHVYGAQIRPVTTPSNGGGHMGSNAFFFFYNETAYGEAQDQGRRLYQQVARHVENGFSFWMFLLNAVCACVTCQAIGPQQCWVFRFSASS